MRIGTKLGALAVVGALAMAFAASASASTVQYNGEATNLKPGQSKGLPVLVEMDLTGKKCPKGPKCFKNAKVQNFSAVSFAWPNCPDVLDTFVDEVPDLPVKKNRKFNELTGGQDPSGFDIELAVNGRFKKKGKSVKGSFTAGQDVCSTGEITWKATPSG